MNHHNDNGNGQEPRHQLAHLYESLLGVAGLHELSEETKHRMWLELVNYEAKNARLVEEKEFAIGELKKSLFDLTEKRFRQQQHNLSNGSSGNNDVSSSNVEFMLNEKEAQVRELLDDLDQKSAEILKLKQTIKDQDLIILSHNTNIYVSSDQDSS